ncbi:hypothetical protein N7478_002204 [Penicillium angulare]|uniref:uncharacterized protein n=1 Tax=Penicillium angulare TaxID=116970 RepID=UPI002541273C|nr:uncharacterized protein N7478_002204 [Penicillium angulare]KAJ5289174.1 hypothetical protein N7478_002204 [Penicillium angulare]
MDEERPLLRQETNDEQNALTDCQTKTSNTEGRMDTITFLALVIGVFISMTCESFVTSTHEHIASTFNALPLGSWLLTSYAMGYSMILPLGVRTYNPSSPCREVHYKLGRGWNGRYCFNSPEQYVYYTIRLEIYTLELQ